MRKLVLLPLAILPLVGCEAVVGDVLDGVELPEAALNRVDLVAAPTAEQLGGYACGESLGATPCGYAGIDVPRKKDLLFRFDVVFDLTNPNQELPIPLVETLLGFTAFDASHLGSLCVSFCDPEDPACAPGQDQEGACDPGSAEDVDGPEDLAPTVEEWIGLAEAAAGGTLDNGDWRVLEPASTLETHLTFELGVDPMLEVSEELVDAAFTDLLEGREPSLVVPITVEGALFFDVPELGRHALGFGPFEDEWDLTEPIP
jgi:hypothetical protein